MPEEDNSNGFTPPSAKELFLTEVTGKEEMVAVTGSLKRLDKKESLGILSQNGLECSLLFSSPEQFSSLNENSIVRAIGKPSKEKGLSIEVEIAQELKDFDSELYERVKGLEKRHYGDTE